MVDAWAPISANLNHSGGKYSRVPEAFLKVWSSLIVSAQPKSITLISSDSGLIRIFSVSYTHLTLPTKA